MPSVLTNQTSVRRHSILYLIILFNYVSNVLSSFGSIEREIKGCKFIRLDPVFFSSFGSVPSHPDPRLYFTVDNVNKITY